MAARRRVRRITTDDDLAAAGFTRDEVDRLEGIAVHYPFIEFIDSNRQFEHLRFLKWLIQTGRVKPSASTLPEQAGTLK